MFGSRTLSLGVLTLCLFAGGGNARGQRSDERPAPDVRDPEAEGRLDREAEEAERVVKVVGAHFANEKPRRPRPLVEIPDNPPPHEGAMHRIPYIIEPSDLIQVEVLESLPGRPITGERLVRGDGTVSLDFYGSVPVAGLTVEQAKANIILHLRKYLTDEVLGLYETYPDESVDRSNPDKAELHSGSDTPDEEREDRGRGVEEGAEQRLQGPRAIAVPGDGPVQADEGHAGSGNGQPVRVELEFRDGKFYLPIMPVPVFGAVPGGMNPATPVAPADVPGSATRGAERIGGIIEPEDSDRVWVDVTAYNTKVFYVVGDVASPGRLPITGHETVLDGINHADGLTPFADKTDIVLHRPSRLGGKTRHYRINLDAIERGDAKANLQLFPGDRIVVARDPLVLKRSSQDRTTAVLNGAANAVLTTANMLKKVNKALHDVELTDEERRRALDAVLESVNADLPETVDGFDREEFADSLRKLLTPDSEGDDESRPGRGERMRKSRLREGRGEPEDEETKQPSDEAMDGGEGQEPDRTDDVPRPDRDEEPEGRRS